MTSRKKREREKEREKERWIDQIDSVVDLILSMSRWTEPEEGGLSFSLFPIL